MPTPPAECLSSALYSSSLCSADTVDRAFLWFPWQCVLLQNFWPPLLGSLQLLFLSFCLLNAKCSEVWFSAISYSQNHPQLLFYLSLYVWLSCGHQTWLCLGNTIHSVWLEIEEEAEEEDKEEVEQESKKTARGEEGPCTPELRYR